MILPTPILFSALNGGDVFTVDLSAYLMKCDATTAVNLANGTTNTAVNPNLPCLPFPNAHLVLN